MGIAQETKHHHLQLVAETETPAPALRGSRWPIDLWRFPYRPSEMPESLVISIPVEAGDRARRERLPPALWARLAIEAERARDRVVNLTQRDPRDVDEQVQRVARARGTKVMGISPLARYASAVLGGCVSGSFESPNDVEVFIPSEMAHSWGEAAAARNETLETWTRAALLRSAPGAGVMEGQAAAAGESLAAWYYAASLA